MTVRARLTLTFAAVGALLVLPAVFAALRLSELRQLAVEGRGRHAEAVQALGRIEAGLTGLDAALRSYVAAGGAGKRQAALEALREIDLETARIEAAGYLEAAPHLRGAVSAVEAEVTSIDTRVQAGERLETVDDFEAAAVRARELLRELSAGIELRAQGDFERARGISTAALRTTLLAALVTVVLAVILSAWTTGALTHPLRQLRTAVARVTEGDFGAPTDLPYARRDEIGELSVSFGVMSRRLAELDRLRAEFLGVASHELKTPINVIRGYAELMVEDLGKQLTPQRRELLQRIEEQTHILTRQVSRLMDISLLETGCYVVEPESVLVSDLLMGVERAFEVVARERGLELTTEIAPGTPQHLVVDVDLIRDDVLSNLVSNALKFTPAGGQVRVRARGEAGGVTIEVSDTGPGVPEEHRPYLFEKYYQVERSRSMGSGLGLAIAKEMVEVHGGSIGLVEGEGSGATFRVHLPAPGRGEAAPAVHPEASAA